jgi:cellulose synthase/poly-beta-1,6-N-acetylglucosamine synthase-like glycosyltransferase
VISFIIPAHNEARMLSGTLRTLRASAQSSGQECEIIVVDDASEDATSAVALLHGAQVLRVEHRHIAATRNSGAQIATGETLIFVDADTHVYPDLLASAIASLASGSVGGGCAVRLWGEPTRPERWMIAALSWVFRHTSIAPGCFLFCTRSAFTATGGFDSTLYAAEDIAMSRALARQGLFTILKEAAFTSDRKLRTHGLMDHLRLFARFFRHGPALLRSRDHLGLWYGDRRHP